MAIRKITLTDLRMINREPTHSWDDILPGDLVRSGKYAFTPFSGIALVLEVNLMTRQATLLIGDDSVPEIRIKSTLPGVYTHISASFTIPKGVP